MTQQQIVIANRKGGVGKTTLASLLIEWFVHREKTVGALDADTNQTLSTWISDVAEEGREVLTHQNPDILIVDTRGDTASAASYFENADLIILPFQYGKHAAAGAVNTLDAIREEYRNRVRVVPNRVRPLGLTRKQAIVKALLGDVLNEYGVGVLPLLSDRPGIFEDYDDGWGQNFFTADVTVLTNGLEEVLKKPLSNSEKTRMAKGLENAQQEVRTFCEAVEAALGDRS